VENVRCSSRNGRLRSSSSCQVGADHVGRPDHSDDAFVRVFRPTPYEADNGGGEHWFHGILIEETLASRRTDLMGPHANGGTKQHDDNWYGPGHRPKAIGGIGHLATLEPWHLPTRPNTTDSNMKGYR
jgi:hypothetical protein